MRAYIVLEIEVIDPVKYDKYRQISGASIEQYGGRFIVRGGRLDVLEGDWAPKRLVVLEFPSADQAKAVLTVLRRIAEPASANPPIISAQLAGSGTAAAV